MFDDDRPKKPSGARPGEDLSLLSLDELAERVRLYRAEIERLEAEISAKQTSRSAAENFFKR